ncbi:MAG: tRNA lysidine(34) synthetase TilS [Pseudomonadota bacterium]
MRRLKLSPPDTLQRQTFSANASTVRCAVLAAAERAGGQDCSDLSIQLERLFEGVAQNCDAPFLLAVSGGSDSLALLHLFARWAQGSLACSVATVDHGLRPESAAEAAFVGEQCRALGLRHKALRWVRAANADKASQENARQARYQLLADYAQSIGAKCVLLGHTRDDQIETLRMRFGRLEGADYAALGTAGISPDILFDGVTFHRPLLGVARSVLRAWLSAEGVERWVEDPTNEDLSYERIRIRTRGQTGKSCETDASLLRLQAISRRWRSLVEAQSLAFAKQEVGTGLNHLRIPAPKFYLLPEAVQRFVLGVAIASVGRSGRRADGAGFVRDLRSLVAGQKGFSMSGAVVSHQRKAEIIIYPEVRHGDFLPDARLMADLAQRYQDLPFEARRAVAWRISQPGDYRFDWSTPLESELFDLLVNADFGPPLGKTRSR